MVKIARENGFSIVVRIGEQEHGPPHVHVFYGSEEVKVAIGEPGVERPWVMDNVSMRLPNVWRAEKIVEAYQERCLEAWRKYHG